MIITNIELEKRKLKKESWKERWKERWKKKLKKKLREKKLKVEQKGFFLKIDQN